MVFSSVCISKPASEPPREKNDPSPSPLLDCFAPELAGRAARCARFWRSRAVALSLKVVGVGYGRCDGYLKHLNKNVYVP
jgi:hypothetical protein